MPRSETIPYLPEIDALRAIAVLLVILFHLRCPLFPGGFVGVDVFFFISGYLIFISIQNRLQEGSFSLLSFYAGRVRRIGPALLFMVAMVYVADIFLPAYLGDLEFSDLRNSLATSLGCCSNYWFWLHTGYFDAPATTQPFLHTWALGVEAQFYFLSPLFLLFVDRFMANREGKGKVLLLAFVPCLTLAIAVTRHDPGLAFYSFPTRAYEFLLGGWLAIKSSAPKSKLKREWYTMTGLALILASAVLFNRVAVPAWPGAWALLPCLGAALFILGQSSNNCCGGGHSYVSSQVGLLSASALSHILSICGTGRYLSFTGGYGRNFISRGPHLWHF